MKFIVGLVTGAALGVAGAVIYAGRSGQDLREMYATVKSDIDKRDFDALGSRLEARFAEMQAQIEQRIAEAKEKSGTAMVDVREAAEETAEKAGDALEEAGDTAEKAAQKAGDAAGDAVEQATEAAQGQA